MRDGLNCKKEKKTLINKSNSIAETLLHALPYIQKYHKQKIVIKYGGSAQTNSNLKEKFAKDIVLLSLVGIKIVVVHGGGNDINSMLEALGIKSEFVDGHRITSDESMKIAEMVLSGNINNEIVSLLNHHGAKALGLSGKDFSFIKAKPKANGKFGLTGEITSVDKKIINNILKQNIIPVVAPIACSEKNDYKGFNINADMVASKIASSIKAKKVIFLTDTAGVLDKNKKLLNTLTQDEVIRLKKDKTIIGGMLPKVDASLEAINNGVDNAHIIDGRIEHSLLLEILTDEGIGTIIHKKS